MPLQTGTRLGPYEIQGQLGAGGMGEVYKALDTRLNRIVAVKVLPPQFSATPEMKQRFDREAQTVAALNHPHICTLHDVGRQGDTDFLVMEYLQGETLAARIGRGPLAIDEALKVAIAVTDALEKAHGQGVTHRDLKPGNIMLTETGAKLLDFGLAKVTQTAQATASGSLITAPGSSATTPGTILGTMQYMAPEQLEGKEADARTDIFAFGAVLYEMVTGRRAFEGKSQAHLIAAILSTQPEPISKLQAGAPSALDFLVRRCLAKDPEERVQTATDLVWKLRWIAGGATEGTLVPAPARRRPVPVAHVALGAVTAIVMAMAAAVFVFPRDTGARPSNRFLVDVPDMPVPEAVSISPDGRMIAYSAADGAGTAIFIRPIGREVGQKLAGTEGAGRLFWSPDSKWIGFFAGGRLKKVEAAGGPPQNICETPDLLGATWNAAGVIVFGSSKGLQRVLAAGGQPSQVELAGDVGKQSPREPYFLPDGRHFLFLAGSPKADTGAGAEAAIYAGSLESTGVTRVVASRSNAVYADPGYLLFHREGTLYAQAFDAEDLTVDGEAVRLADGLPYGDGGAAAFAAADRAALVFRNDPRRQATASGPTVTAGGSFGGRPLRWIPRNGTAETAAEAAEWSGVDLAPDGKRAAAHRHDGDGGDVWVFQVGQPTPAKFTFEAAQDNASPIWSPDGTRIAFSSQRNGKRGLYVKAADNSRAEELLLESEVPVMPMSWSGERLVYWANDQRTAGDIWSVGTSGDKKPVPILQTPADERNPQVSADGKWLAYSSNETGRSEVYIRPFPEGPGKIQVSVNGGVFPRWRRDGRELYFMSLVSLGSMMGSAIRVNGDSVDREVPRTLFQTLFVSNLHSRGQSHAFAVTADGQRFLVPQFESPAAGFGRGGAQAAVAAVLVEVGADRRAAGGSVNQSSSPLTVVLDWTKTLRQ